MLSSTAYLPNAFWGEALQNAVCIIHWSPHNSLKGGIPEEIWFCESSWCDHLLIFGCEAFVHIRQELRNKLDAKSIECIFWGYSVEGEMGYRIYLHHPRKVIRSCDVVFNEAKLLKSNCTSLESTKRVKFQQQPTIGSRITSQGDEQVDIYKVILLPKEDGQQKREILDPKDEAQIQPQQMKK